MIREATLHHPARDKKEKTSNNFLKSPLCGCEQSCSGRRGRIAICCIMKYCLLQLYTQIYIANIERYPRTCKYLARILSTFNIPCQVFVIAAR